MIIRLNNNTINTRGEAMLKNAVDYYRKTGSMVKITEQYCLKPFSLTTFVSSGIIDAIVYRGITRQLQQLNTREKKS